tara:strand:+ start:26884 stop:27228 length:345 start_codon:yes stop_codon:yes gene_type:complete
MAHYAVLDNNIVTQVFVGKDGGDTNWEEYYGAKRTSYNTFGGVHSEDGTPFRKNYAGIGYTYDEERDAFIPPQPFASWTLNEDTCLWESPVPYPSEGMHEWDETNGEWVELWND